MIHFFTANYNWNSGFDVPKALIENEYCDLGTGLLIFHYADGFQMLENPEGVSNSALEEWKDFLLNLYNKLLKMGFKTRFEKPSVWLYLAMGWAGVIVFWQGMQRMSTLSIVFLLLGGAAYSLGVFFYRWRSLRFSHAIWHLFVLAGSIFHYFSVLNLASSPI